MKTLKQLAEQGQIEIPPAKKGWRNSDGSFTFCDHTFLFKEWGHVTSIEPDDVRFQFDEENALCPDKNLTGVILQCQRIADYHSDRGFNPFFRVRVGDATYKIYTHKQPYSNSPLAKAGTTPRAELILSDIPNS